MSLKALSLLLLVVFLSGCSARPRDLLNEVNSSQEASSPDDYINNDQVQHISNRPVVGQSFFQQRAQFFQPVAQLWRRFYQARSAIYPEIVIPHGGANYYSNEVPPLATYELVEPEPLYGEV